MPPPLSPVGAPAPGAPPSRCNSSSFPHPIRSHGHRCTCLTRKAARSKAAWWLWPFDLEHGLESCVMWATSAKFGLARPLCSRVRPWQRYVRQKHCLMSPPIRSRGIIIMYLIQSVSHVTVFDLNHFTLIGLQCSDTVGWPTGRASGR